MNESTCPEGKYPTEKVNGVDVTWTSFESFGAPYKSCLFIKGTGAKKKAGKWVQKSENKCRSTCHPWCATHAQSWSKKEAAGVCTWANHRCTGCPQCQVPSCGGKGWYWEKSQTTTNSPTQRKNIKKPTQANTWTCSGTKKKRSPLARCLSPLKDGKCDFEKDCCYDDSYKTST